MKKLIKILEKTISKANKTDKAIFIILGVVLLLRIPSLFEPYWYGDEAIYLTLGEGIRRGLTLYKDIFDHKPQAIYLLAAIAGSLFWFKFILLLWHMTATALFWKLANLLLRNRKGVILATATFAVLTTIPLIEGNVVNSEILMLASTIGAFVILLQKKSYTYKLLLAAGLLFSVSILLKIPGILDVFAILTFWLFSSKKKDLLQTIKRVFFIIAVILSPIALSAIYYWIRGDLQEYLSIVFFFNVTYLTLWNPEGFKTTAPLAQQITNVNLLARTVILAAILLVLALFRKKIKKTILFMLLWFIFTMYSVLLSGRPYPHYLIQIVPSLSLLVAVVLYERSQQKLLPIPFFGILAVSLVFYKFYYYPTFAYYQNFLEFISGTKTKEEYFRSFDPRTLRTYKLATFLNARTVKSDNVFIWGTAPEIYALSRRLPPGRFITSFHIKDLGAKKETINSLLASPPKYILVLKEEKEPFPELDAFLTKNYLKIDEIEGVEIWRLFGEKLIQALSRFGEK